MTDEDDIVVCDNVQGSVVFLAVRTLVKELLLIEIPSLKEYALAFQAAFESSWRSLSAWASVLTLFLSPVLQLLAVFARAVWPHARAAAVGLWKYQASLPLSVLYMETAAAAFIVAAILLRRFIVRRRYLPRARRRLRLLRARWSGAYVTFAASVERKFQLSARAFPHVVYWTAAGLFAWLAPELAGTLRDNFWVVATATWPTTYAIYLVLLVRSQDGLNAEDGAGGGSVSGAPSGDGAGTRGTGRNSARTPLARAPGAGAPARSAGSGPARGASVLPQDVDRVLMYWVVFTVARCWGEVAAYVPETIFAPHVRTVLFLSTLWMHLPGPGSGLQVVYALLEPLVHTYVRDLRMPENGHTGTLKRVQDVLVFVRLLSEENAELLVDNITDSWMLAPALVCFVTPSFITKLACLFAGLVVPSFNTIKTLGRRSNTSTLSSGWASLATSSGSARVRWLTYWVAYGSWWHLSLGLGGVLRVLPLAAHAELALVLWLQVPVFRGAGRTLNFVEACMDRWTYGGPDVSPARLRPPQDVDQ